MCLRIFIFVSLNLLVTQCQELDETVSEQLITNEGFKNVYQNWLLAHQDNSKTNSIDDFVNYVVSTLNASEVINGTTENLDNMPLNTSKLVNLGLDSIVSNKPQETYKANLTNEPTELEEDIVDNADTELEEDSVANPNTDLEEDSVANPNTYLEEDIVATANIELEEDIVANANNFESKKTNVVIQNHENEDLPSHPEDTVIKNLYSEIDPSDLTKLSFSFARPYPVRAFANKEGKLASIATEGEPQTKLPRRYTSTLTVVKRKI